MHDNTKIALREIAWMAAAVCLVVLFFYGCYLIFDRERHTGYWEWACVFRQGDVCENWRRICKRGIGGEDCK